MFKLTHYEWRESTSKLIQKDPKLQAVDSAFRACRRDENNIAKLQTLVLALEDWKAAGISAKYRVVTSENVEGDLTDLIAELYNEAKQEVANQQVKEQNALRHVQNEPEISFQKICARYGPLKLESRPTFLDKLKAHKWQLNGCLATYHLAKTTYESKMNAQETASNFVKDFLQKISAGVSNIGPDISNEVINELEKLLPGKIGEVVAAFVPFAPGIIAVSKGVWDFKKIVENEIDAQKIKEHILASGTPQEAIDAMLKVLDRELSADIISEAKGLATYCLNVGSIVLAATPGVHLATGVLNTVKSLFALGNDARIIARDTTEKRAANALLSKLSKEDIKIKVLFESCPILGAYYVCCVPGSVLVNRIFGSWEKPLDKNLQDQIAKAVDHDGPLVKKARELIGNHRYVINGLQKCPGVETRAYPIDIEDAGQLAGVGRMLVVDHIGADQDRRPLGK